MSDRWTAESIPPELAAILDERANKEHSATGAVRSCLAEILNRYDELPDGQGGARMVHVVRTEGPTSELFAGPFHDEDRLEAWLAENRTPAWTHVQVAPLEQPVLLADIPDRERLVHEDPALAARIREGIAEAERGETVDLGSFAQHLDEDEVDEEPCCEDADELSSHYHCPRCHARVSMMGHGDCKGKG